MNLNKINTQNILSVIVSLMLFAAVPTVLAWTPPSANPPSNNTAGPVTVGAGNQVKSGSLGLGGLAVFGRGIFTKNDSYKLPESQDVLLGVNGSVGAKSYCDEKGQNCFTPSNTGVNYSSIPSGAVMSFDLATCPSGWSLFQSAQGRFIVGTGNSGTPGATALPLGSAGGEATHVLTIAEMPAHDHPLVGGANIGNIGNGPAWTGYPYGEYPSYVNTIRAGYAGGSQPHNNMPPYYALTYCKKN